MSKDSNYEHQKVPRDWANSMENYQLNVDGSTVVSKNKRTSSITTNRATHNRRKRLGFIVISAAMLAGTYALFTQPSLQLNSLINIDGLLSATTPTSQPTNKAILPSAEHTTLVAKPSQKPAPETRAQVTTEPKITQDKMPVSFEPSHIPPDMPKYITLTKKLSIQSIETLSANSNDDSTASNSQWKTYILSRHEKADKALSKLGIQLADRKTLFKNKPIASQLAKISKGSILRALVIEGKLVQLVSLLPNDKNSFVISKQNKSFRGSYKRKIIEAHQLRDTLFISHSLRYDANQAKIPRSIIKQLIAIFDRDVKLTRDLRKGDRLTFVYTEIKHLGMKIDEGKVLAAELTHDKRAHRAISFKQQGGKNAFFDEHGYDLSKAFIRRPLQNFKRISSSFGMRHHPIRKRYLMHTGVDFAAKHGTHVKVTGTGVIKHIARKGSYGKTIIVQHANGYTTRYAHLSGYKKGLKPGSKVYLGDVIGYVGSTGRSTGNHLHYEFRINGKPYNPEKVKLPQSLSLSATERQRFRSKTQNLRRQLDVLQRFVEEKVDIDSAIGG